MITWKEFQAERLEEMAIAQKGNLKDYGEFLTTYKRGSVDDYMTLVDKSIKIDKLSNYKLELYQIKNRKTNQPDYLLGFWTTEDVDTKVGIEKKEVFQAIWAIQVAKREITLKQYKNVINIDGVFTTEDIQFRRKGISTFMYQYLVNKLHFTILGDLEQFFGARKLWTGLSKIKSMQVDVIDLSKNTVVIDNAILVHGEKDEEFDKRIWDTEESKSYISKNFRCILTKING
jgi:hypothetical protein